MSSQERFEKGFEKLYEITGEIGIDTVEKLGDLGLYITEYVYGDIYSRPELGLRDRELATIAILAAMGGRERQLAIHISAGLKAGLTKTEIEEVIIQTSVFAGFPAAMNALHVLEKSTSGKSKRKSWCKCLHKARSVALPIAAVATATFLVAVLLLKPRG